jgi:hypothetical protein
VREADAVPDDGRRRQLRLELEDLEDRAAGDPDPADLAAGLVSLYPEEAPDPIGRRVGHAHQGTAEDLPVELHRLVEVRHGDAGMTERSSSHMVSVN